MNPIRPVVPFYFGLPGKPLFGCFHQPPPGRSRKCAVLICQPVGHEYINSHRALRQLAARLCDAGFPVLRFDYYGCGDSAGDAEEGRVPQWLEDVSTAIAELRQRTGLVQLCMVGLRLGGALSAMAGAQRGDVESMVLWDPVVNGRSYLEKLLVLQKEMLRFRPRPKGNHKSRGYMDILGFPVSYFLYRELTKINLLAVAEKPAKNVLMLESAQAAPADNLKNHLSRTEVRLQHQRSDHPEIWLPTTDGSLLVPGQALQAVVSWVLQTHP